jgi:hypothetical protein
LSAADLQRAGHGFAEIAEILNGEGWHPAKRRDTFNATMVHYRLPRAATLPFVKGKVGRPVKLVHADATTIATLKAVRATPAPCRRLPPPFMQPINPTAES